MAGILMTISRVRGVISPTIVDIEPVAALYSRIAIGIVMAP
jgi:hypothetical protein